MNSTVVTGEAPPQIADHVLVRRIGKGAYGDVWLAKNVIGGFRAAKVIYRQRFGDERPFQREFEGICKFEPISRSHPGLVTILQVGQNEQAGYFYYVMELADDVRVGQTIEVDSYLPRTLKEEIANHSRRPLETSLQIALSLTSALGHLHAQELIHRDIKPSNIIFVNGAPKLADVGLITEVGDDVSAVGSVGFMPPEGPGDVRADIFSLGKVFYELFMGLPCKRFPELPDAAEEFMTVPGLLELNSLILKACHFDPRQRFQTTDELHKALVAVTETVQGKRQGVGARNTSDSLQSKAVETGSKAALAEGRVSRPSEGGPIPSSEPQAKPHWARWAALLVVLLAIAVGVFLVAIKRAPVVVLMDTTAERGIYDDDNKKTGRSNAKELYEIIRREIREIPPENIDEQSVGLNWDRRSRVILQHADLVVIHRSVFYHPVAAALGFLYPDQIKTNFSDAAVIEAELEQFNQRYKVLGDDELREFLHDVGSAEPRTRFLVYSRGTDTNWLSDDYRMTWIRKLEADYPPLRKRVKTMVIKGESKGTFRNDETREELLTGVREMLGLPEKRKPDKGR